MIYLENFQGKKLSKGIRDLSPIQYDAINIKNRLLDGSYHIQTIGNPSKYVTFDILANHNQVDLINISESRGEELKLLVNLKAYIGILDEALIWSRITARYANLNDVYYIARARLNIIKEGIE